MPALSVLGQPPPPLFFPPFPNEEKMRRGRLNAEAPLGLLGETHSVGRRKAMPLSGIGCDLYFSNSTDNFASASRSIPPSGPQYLQARSSWAADPVFRSGFGFEPRFVKLPEPILVENLILCSFHYETSRSIMPDHSTGRP